MEFPPQQAEWLHITISLPENATLGKYGSHKSKRAAQLTSYTVTSKNIFQEMKGRPFEDHSIVSHIVPQTD